MAQTGYTPISLYYSATASTTPTAGNLVDGELAINTADGKLFYKDSSGVVQTLATKDTTAGTFTSITDSGNLTFTGTGNRIRGDFSNATTASRVMFQTSTTDSNTLISTIPSGTATSSQLNIFNSSDPNNALRGIFGVNASSLFIQAAITGTGTYLPLTMATGGSERLRIDTAGFVGIGTTAPARSFTVSVSAAYDNVILAKSAAANSYVTFADAGTTDQTGLSVRLGSAGNAMVFQTGGTTERMRIDSSGNVGIGTASPTVKLQVAGTITSSTGVFNASGNNFASFTYTGTSVNTSGVYTGLDSGGGFAINVRDAGYQTFSTSNTERMRLDASGNLGIGTSSPNASAILDVQSTTKGVRMPNMTTTQKNAISSPAAGLMVFDTTLAKLCVYSGSAWQTITSI